MSKLFQWSAIATSSFALLAGFSVFVNDSDWAEDWSGEACVAFVFLAAICGATCIVSAIFRFFKKGKEFPN